MYQSHLFLRFLGRLAFRIRHHYWFVKHHQFYDIIACIYFVLWIIVAPYIASLHDHHKNASRLAGVSVILRESIFPPAIPWLSSLARSRIEAFPSQWEKRWEISTQKPKTIICMKKYVFVSRVHIHRYLSERDSMKSITFWAEFHQMHWAPRLSWGDLNTIISIIDIRTGGWSDGIRNHRAKFGQNPKPAYGYKTRNWRFSQRFTFHEWKGRPDCSFVVEMLDKVFASFIVILKKALHSKGSSPDSTLERLNAIRRLSLKNSFAKAA